MSFEKQDHRLQHRNERIQADAAAAAETLGIKLPLEDLKRLTVEKGSASGLGKHGMRIQGTIDGRRIKIEEGYDGQDFFAKLWINGKEITNPAISRRFAVAIDSYIRNQESADEFHIGEIH